MTLTSIYNKVKQGLVKGTSKKHLLIYMEGTAWQYAYECLKDKPKESVSVYNELFMDIYTMALKTLKKAR